MKKIFKTIALLLLSVLLCLPCFAQAETVQAADAPNFCNLVIFVRFSDDGTDILNEADNWAGIKKYMTVPAEALITPLKII